MLHGFGRARTSIRCCIRVDVRKAFDNVDVRLTFDTVRWNVVLENLRAMGFSIQFILLIEHCI